MAKAAGLAMTECRLLQESGRAHFMTPRAQAAHQQASLMVTQDRRRIAGKPLAEYLYRDFGSLVSLDEHNTVGNMMSGLGGQSRGKGMIIEGFMARMMYVSLYKMNELALHGFVKVALDTTARLITQRTEPHLKLH